MDIADFLISALIPFIIMITFSCITGYYLINNKTKLNLKKFKKEKRLYKILISMNIFFFLCYFPWSAYVITNDVYILNNISADYMSIVYNITNFIIFLYCSCSFFVHLICNRKFRSYLLACLKFKNETVNLVPNSYFIETKNL
jgi:ABC-type transport system involved in cytochrome c biogenesis permease subunit